MAPSKNLLASWGEAFGRLFVFASSIAVYGEREDRRPAGESAKPNPVSAYGTAKLEVESEIRKANAATKLPFLILRYAPMFGPTPAIKPNSSVVNNFLRALQTGDEAVISADLETHREYLYAKDGARFTAELLSSGPKDLTLNVGNGQDITLAKVIEVVEEVTGKHLRARRAEPTGVDPKYLVMDVSNLRRRIRAEPTPFVKAVAETWAWLRKSTPG